MKRWILFVLVIVMVVSSAAFAEEVEELHTHTYTIVLDLPRPIEGTSKPQTFDYTFKTKDVKQPLIFEGTEENPKTGFSYMCPEEIVQLPSGERSIPWEYDGDTILSRIVVTFNVKKALLEIEKVFEYKTLKNGIVQKKIRTVKKGKIDEYNIFGIYAGKHEYRILYEQLCYIFIEYFVPYTVVYTNVQGTTLEKINKMYLSNTPDCDYLFWITNKPASRKKADQEYIREALLSVTEKEFDEVFGLIHSQFGRYIYKGENDEYYIRTVPPTNEIKRFYGIK